MGIKRKKWFIRLVVCLVMVTGVSALVMLLWNVLIPQITNWSEINFWQALGLLVLSRLLLGNWNQIKSHIRERCDDGESTHEMISHLSRKQKHEYIREYMARKRGKSPSERDEQ